jgi:hypothetical protein
VTHFASNAGVAAPRSSAQEPRDENQTQDNWRDPLEHIAGRTFGRLFCVMFEGPDVVP